MSFILSSHLLFSPSTTTSTTTATTTNPPAIPSPIVTGNFILTINYRLIVNGPQWEEKCEKIRNMILTSMANWKNGVRSGFMTVSCCPSLPVRHTNHHSINFFTSPRTDFCINFTFQSNQCPCEWHSDSFAALQMAWYDELKKNPHFLHNHVCNMTSEECRASLQDLAPSTYSCTSTEASHAC